MLPLLRVMTGCTRVRSTFCTVQTWYVFPCLENYLNSHTPARHLRLRQIIPEKCDHQFDQRTPVMHINRNNNNVFDSMAIEIIANKCYKTRKRVLLVEEQFLIYIYIFFELSRNIEEFKWFYQFLINFFSHIQRTKDRHVKWRLVKLKYNF